MANTHSATQVLIAGAGIGGLATAIALARKDIPSQVLERAKVHSTHGAGIQLGPNATRILRRWDILGQLNAQALYPEQITIRSARSGHMLASVPLGETAEKRYGAPYIALHRSDLHRALLQSARAHDAISLRLGFEVDRVNVTEGSVSVVASDGESARGALLVGADGVWSKIRRQVDPNAQMRFSGKTAWRGLVDLSKAPQSFQRPEVGLWMSPHVHLVHYPVKRGKFLNLVAVINDRWAEQGWNAPGERHEITPHFQNWPEDIRSLISQIEDWRKWSLNQLPRLKKWSSHRIVLLGDAAHPVLPFLAQGGALAIEDAQTLANALAASDASPAPALRTYEAKRMKRAAAVQIASQRMGRIYHLSGPMALARNLVLRASLPGRLLARYDWLYHYRDDD